MLLSYERGRPAVKAGRNASPAAPCAVGAPGNGAVVARVTGPLRPLAGRRVLVIADVENLTYGAADLGLTLRYRRLSMLVASGCAAAEFHAYFSREREDRHFEDLLAANGWEAHPRDIETVVTVHGRKRCANSDHAIAFGAGVYATQPRFDAVVLATGDGDLGCEIAAAVRRERGPGLVLCTLSLAGSTSRRLDAAHSGDIDANLEIGLDCLSGEDGASVDGSGAAGSGTGRPAAFSRAWSRASLWSGLRVGG